MVGLVGNKINDPQLCICRLDSYRNTAWDLSPQDCRRIVISTSSKLIVAVDKSRYSHNFVMFMCSKKRAIVSKGAFLTILFPIDHFSDLGPLRTFCSDGGFSREQIIDLIRSFYQVNLLSFVFLNITSLRTTSKIKPDIFVMFNFIKIHLCFISKYVDQRVGCTKIHPSRQCQYQISNVNSTLKYSIYIIFGRLP